MAPSVVRQRREKLQPKTRVHISLAVCVFLLSTVNASAKEDTLFDAGFTYLGPARSAETARTTKEFGKENRVFSRVGDWMQQHTGQRLPAEVGELTPELTFNLMDLLPHNTHHFSYHGSLTTPPCSEAVLWIVLKTPITISKVQADRFFTTIGPNAPPVQPLQHRDILEIDDAP